jgi:hypothetical protein
MRDWNSITHDRYYDSNTKKKTVGFGIFLEISIVTWFVKEPLT